MRNMWGVRRVEDEVVSVGPKGSEEVLVEAQSEYCIWEQKPFVS